MKDKKRKRIQKNYKENHIKMNRKVAKIWPLYDLNRK